MALCRVLLQCAVVVTYMAGNVGVFGFLHNEGLRSLQYLGDEPGVAPNTTVVCRTECPTLYREKDSIALWLLVCMYAVVGFFGVFILVKGRASVLSYRNVFLGLQTLLCAYRIVTFSALFKWNFFTLLLLLYCFPIFLQFVTFSLLIVFLLKCLLVMQERQHLVHRYLYPTYVFIVLGLAAACVSLSYYAYKRESASQDNHGFDQGVSRFGVLVFGLLTVCLTLTGVKTHRLLMRFVLSEARRSQVVGVSYVVFVYCIVFLVRAVWSVLYILNQNPLQSKMNHLQSQTNPYMYYWTVFVFYLMFEILPTFFLLYSFYNWAKPTGGFAKRQKRNPYGNAGINQHDHGAGDPYNGQSQPLLG